VKLRIAIEERVYEVDVEVLEEPRPEPVVPTPYLPYPATAAMPAHHTARPSGAAADASSPSSDGGVPCKSPVNGVVVKVVVEVGQEIEAGAPLVVLEAMKMQTSVTAPASGTVSRVHVKPTDTVKRDQVLVELRAP
jgi:methylmalonyl-CoA carboxyltransferase small subunit